MVGADLQIGRFIAGIQICAPASNVWLVHNRLPDSEPYTLDGGSGKNPEYFVTISTSSPEQTGIH